MFKAYSLMTHQKYGSITEEEKDVEGNSSFWKHFMSEILVQM